MSVYKKIVLLKGLECMDDCQFRIIKSLLRRELHLSESMQNDCDRIQIADMMEDTFPKDAGLSKLIGFCQEHRDLQCLVEDLKAEKAKVEKQKKGKNKTAVEGKQGEPSSAHVLCSSNAPSSEEEQPAETESGIKRKLNQEQNQPLEPSGSNTQKDEGCLQTSEKPATPSSNSSNKKQKTTNTKNQSTLKTDDSQEKHQLLGLSATSNSSAAWEGHTFQGLTATASSSLTTPQTSPETCDSLKMVQGSPAPPCQSFPITSVSDSSIHLNSPVTLTLSNHVQTPYVPSSTATSNVWVPSVCSETVSSSLIAPQISPVSVSSSSLQVLPLTTSNSLLNPWVPRPIATSRVQTTQMHPAAASSFIQAPHAPPLTKPRSVCPTQDHQGVASSTGQTLPCPKVETPRCALAPQMPSATTSESRLAPPTTSKSLVAPMVSPATTSSSSCETPRKGNVPKEPAKEEGYHREPKEVMVLKVTEPFTYDLILDKRMFHATVATENEFYRVKIFDPVLKNKFIPNKIIAISNYFGLNGFLEIHEASCVSDVDKNRTMNISKTLRKRANATPKIRDLFSQAQGTYVSGEFVVYKKTATSSFIYYVIEDDTGKMEVVVHGRLTNIKCEPGQKLRLICFELSSSTDTWQLKSVKHSNIQVVNVGKKVPQA